jgi:hypothetical protein
VAWAGWRRGLEQADQVGTLFGGGGEEKDSPKDELHGGVWRAGRCAGEGGLSAVAGTFDEVVEVHGVVEELLSATAGSERVQRKLVMEELLAAVEEDGDGG